MSLERARLIFQDNAATIGQIAGYGSGAAAWLGLAKDIFGLIGIMAGATLSCLALWERHQRKKAERAARDSA